MKGDFARNIVTTAEEAQTRGAEVTDGVGTVVSVDLVNLTAQVVLADGSANAIPCLVASHAPCIANDKVAVQKFGAQWVVMAVLGVLRALGANGVSQATGTGAAPVGSWGNIPGTPQFSFTKRWASSKVRWTVALGCFTTVLGSTIQSGITYNGGSTTVKTGQYTFANNGGDPALDAHTFTFDAWETGLAAGTYTVMGRWRSDANVQCTAADDWVSVSGVEFL